MSASERDAAGAGTPTGGSLEAKIAAAHLGAELGRIQDGTAYWRIAPERVAQAVAFLKQSGCERFLDLTVVDDPTRQDRFELNYLLYSMRDQRWFRLKASTAAEAPSIVSIFLGAAFYEREVYDLFGVRFLGHPDLKRILLPDDWQGHPLRRDHPLGGEPVDFTVTREVYGP